MDRVKPWPVAFPDPTGPEYARARDAAIVPTGCTGEDFDRSIEIMQRTEDAIFMGLEARREAFYLPIDRAAQMLGAAGSAACALAEASELLIGAFAEDFTGCEITGVTIKEVNTFKVDRNTKTRGSHPQPFYRRGRW